MLGVIAEVPVADHQQLREPLGPDNRTTTRDGVDFRHAAACNCSFGVGFSNQEMMNVKAGDRVLIGKYSGQDIKVNDIEHTILREDEILAIVE